MHEESQRRNNANNQTLPDVVAAFVVGFIVVVATKAPSVEDIGVGFVTTKLHDINSRTS